MGQRITFIQGHPDAGTAGVALIPMALLPMAFAIAGAAFDEWTHRGFTIWRSACRAAGFSMSSVLVFTLELLPMAVLGALLGGLVVQSRGILVQQPGVARGSLSAHAGCFLAMVAALPLCALPIPVPVVVAAEALLAAVGAMLMHHLSGHLGRGIASGELPTGRVPSA